MDIRLNDFLTAIDDATSIEEIADLLKMPESFKTEGMAKALAKLIKPFIKKGLNAESSDVAKQQGELLRKTRDTWMSFTGLSFRRLDEGDQSEVANIVFPNESKAIPLWIEKILANPELLMIPALEKEVKGDSYRKAMAAIDKEQKILRLSFGFKPSGKEAPFISWLVGEKILVKDYYDRFWSLRTLNPVDYADSEINEMLALGRAETELMLKDLPDLATVIDDAVESFTGKLSIQEYATKEAKAKYKKQIDRANELIRDSKQEIEIALAAGDEREVRLSKMDLRSNEEYLHEIMEYVDEWRDEIVVAMSLPGRIKDLERGRLTTKEKNRWLKAKAKHFDKLLGSEMEDFKKRIFRDSKLTAEDVKEWSTNSTFSQGFTRSMPKSYKIEQFLKDGQEFYRLVGGNVKPINYLGQSNRANASKEQSAIDIGSKFTKRTYFHELGHHVEFTNAFVFDAAKQLMHKRNNAANAQGKYIMPLSELTGMNYGRDERAIDDDFFDFYVGKVYSRFGTIEHATATEVISMGLEKFISPGDAALFAMQDREHFELIVGIIKKLNEVRNAISES